MAYTSKELQTRASITSRQMDHWFKRGWLISFDRKPEEGSGIPIEWPERAVRKAILMNAFVKAGFNPERAHQIAEKAMNRSTVYYPFSLRIGAHLTVTIFGEGI